MRPSIALAASPSSAPISAFVLPSTSLFRSGVFLTYRGGTLVLGPKVDRTLELPASTLFIQRTVKPRYSQRGYYLLPPSDSLDEGRIGDDIIEGDVVGVTGRGIAELEPPDGGRPQRFSFAERGDLRPV